MNNNNLNILLTRPLEKSQQLAKTLQPLAAHIEITPLFAYQAGEQLAQLQQQIQNQNPQTIIFISQAAVEYALTAISVATLKLSATIIAVGNATAQALVNAGISNVVIPQQHTSEGILALAQLQNINNDNILIIRGNGGRELLKQQLQHRGAKVVYNEVYQRTWLQLNAPQTIEKWHKAKINCIVITSNELLVRLLKLTTNAAWLKQCLWIVASARIAKQAKDFGVPNVYDAQGANNLKIYQAVAAIKRPMEVDYDR